MKTTLKTYNGFRSWNAWNVSLWINNDESIYNYCLALINRYGLRKASLTFMQDHTSIPDGAKYDYLSVYNTLKDLKENN